MKRLYLTTDPDLVKDGIQGIDDEFLEWFGKNPSCDFIEIESQCLIEEKCTCDCINSICKKPYYTLIIPSNNDLKIGDNTNFGIITDLNENSACFGKNKLGVDVWYKRSYVIKFPNLVLDNNEKMYSEDEVWNIIRMVSGMKESGKSDIEISEYFENNKKK